MQKQTTRTINLYSVIITLIAAILLTMLLKTCSDPQITASDMQSAVDSVAFREHLAEQHVDALAVVIADQDSIIQRLQKQKAATRTVIKDRIRVVKEVLTAGAPSCDSVRMALNDLLDVASQYEAESDSIITAYETKVALKDSVIAIKDKLYSELRESFNVAIMSGKQHEQLAIKYKKRSQRERLIMAGAVLITGGLLLKK